MWDEECQFGEDGQQQLDDHHGVLVEEWITDEAISDPMEVANTLMKFCRK